MNIVEMHFWRTPQTEDELSRRLDEYGVDHSNWGEGTCKGLEQLLTELQTGDCRLAADGHGLRRILKAVGVNVFAQTGMEVLQLQEQK